MADDPPGPKSDAECIDDCGRRSRNARNKARRMNCAQLLDKIKELMDTEKSGRAGPKGLVQRFRDFRGDDATHSGNILNDQAALNSYLDGYDSQGCGDPPDGARALANRPLPAPSPQAGSNNTLARDVLITGGVAGGGYLLYRGLRLLPSLFPPLWPTLPANLAVP